MSINVMSHVWEGFPGSGSELLMMLALADWSDEEGGRIYPSMVTLAKRCRISKSQAQRLIRGLEEKGYVAVIGNHHGGAPGTTRQYRLNVARIRAESKLELGHIVAKPKVPGKKASSDPEQTGRMDAACDDHHDFEPENDPSRMDATRRMGAEEGSHGCGLTGGMGATQSTKEHPSEEPPNSCPPIDGPVSADAYSKLAKPIQARMIESVFTHWQTTMQSPRARLDEKRKKILHKALGEYGLQDVLNAITGCARSNYHMGRNDDGSPKPGATKYNDVELIFREASKTERFLDFFDEPQAYARQVDRPDSQAGKFDARVFMQHKTQMGGGYGSGFDDHIDGHAQRLD